MRWRGFSRAGAALVSAGVCTAGLTGCSLGARYPEGVAMICKGYFISIQESTIFQPGGFAVPRVQRQSSGGEEWEMDATLNGSADKRGRGVPTA